VQDAARNTLALVLLLCLACRSAVAVTDSNAISSSRFTGETSCASSGCHGGGEGKNQCRIWEKETNKDKRDKHALDTLNLLTGKDSQPIIQALGIVDATKDIRCTICHSPLDSVPAAKFVPGQKPAQKTGFSCETCHGPAESWLRYHTRTDITHDQRVAAGLHEMRDFYNRSNVCVACHLNLDPEFIKVGHPELLFELDGQQTKEPPHWKDPKDEWQAPRAWLTGQAVALREISWKAGQKLNPDSVASYTARMNGLRWLLRLTIPGKAQLPDAANSDAHATQFAADRLARSAAKSPWSREGTLGQLRKFAESNGDFRDQAISTPEQRCRAAFLVVAIDRFWEVLKPTGLASPNLEKAQQGMREQLKLRSEEFKPALFAALLQQVEVALEEMKPAGAKP